VDEIFCWAKNCQSVARIRYPVPFTLTICKKPKNSALQNETAWTEAFESSRFRRGVLEETEDDVGGSLAEETLGEPLEALSEEEQKDKLLAQTLTLSLRNRVNSLRAARPKKKPRDHVSVPKVPLEDGF
jgi:hypothetical protein